MPRQEGAGSRLARDYLSRFPKAATATLARRAYDEHPAVWPSLDACRSAFRRARGNIGQAHRSDVADKAHFRTPQAPGDPFGKIPEGWRQIPRIIGSTIDGPATVLLLADVHIPFHDRSALMQALQEGRRRGVDTVVLNGDILDAHATSRWEPDPRERDFQDEVRKTRGFLEVLREGFPKARIIYKWGNHEERFKRYMICKAPELLDVDDFQLSHVLRCAKNGVEVLEERQVIGLGKLRVLHGHEFRSQINNPVNPARGLYLRAKANAMCGHMHQVSHHSETSLDGHVTSCWSTGCLSDLHPRYMPLNNWCHGFAIIEIDKQNAFSVNNLRVIDGRIWH